MVVSDVGSATRSKLVPRISVGVYRQGPMADMFGRFGRRTAAADGMDRMTFAVDPAADLQGLAERMVAWKSMGGRIGQRSGANALQLPEIEADEETLGGAPAAPPGDAPRGLPPTPSASTPPLPQAP